MIGSTYNATVDVYAPMFLCDFINFFIVVFGYQSFGPAVSWLLCLPTLICSVWLFVSLSACLSHLLSFFPFPLSCLCLLSCSPFLSALSLSPCLSFLSLCCSPPPSLSLCPCLSVCLSISHFVHVWLAVCLSVCVSVSVCLSVCLSLFLSLSLSLSLSLCCFLCVCLPLSLCVCSVSFSSVPSLSLLTTSSLSVCALLSMFCSSNPGSVRKCVCVYFSVTGCGLCKYAKLYLHIYPCIYTYLPHVCILFM